MTTISGAVQTVRYSGEDGFHILVLDCDGKEVIAVGSFPPVAQGEFLTLTGEFVVHQKFGRQFKAQKAVKDSPKSESALVKYLGSGLFKGVGPKTAQLIVDTFGLKSLDIIESRSHLLSKVKGISRPKAALIFEEFNKNKNVQSAVMFLQEKGITLNMAVKIFKEYGSDTVNTVTHNPYKLIEDIDGIGFLTADRIARLVGIEEDSPHRVRAAVVHSLKEAVERDGHTFLFRHELYAAVERLIGVSDKLDEVVGDLLVSRKLKVVKINGNLPLAKKNEEYSNKVYSEAIYLNGVYQAEKGSAVKLISLIKNGTKHGHDDVCIKSEIEDYQKLYSIEFNDDQKKAVELSLNEGVCVITGGPGTGKTTIIKCLLRLFENRGKECMLMAPTGRAAKRMSESTGAPASTIHRAVMGGVSGMGGGKADREFRQLECDAVIIDEMSMVDVFLLNTLVKSIKEGTSLIILGDSDQLPSVGAGNCLKDLLSRLPSVRLHQIYRQAQESLIVTNAHKINRGLMPDLSQKSGDFFFIKEKSADRMAELVCDLVARRLPAFLGVEADRIQVLCPMKNGEAGTINLNRLLAGVVNKTSDNVPFCRADACGNSLSAVYKAEAAEIKIGDSVFKEGDKIMQTVNNYSLEWTRDGETGEGVFNGDMGSIISVSADPREITVLFEDGRRAAYTDNLDELILSYAITIHKSQGSEYDAVVVPLVSAGGPMIMTRNLLYTAITRAKKTVVLVAEDYTVKRMVENNYIAKRNSALSYFLEEAEGDYDSLFLNGKGLTLR